MRALWEASGKKWRERLEEPHCIVCVLSHVNSNDEMCSLSFIWKVTDENVSRIKNYVGYSSSVMFEFSQICTITSGLYMCLVNHGHSLCVYYIITIIILDSFILLKITEPAYLWDVFISRNQHAVFSTRQCRSVLCLPGWNWNPILHYHAGLDTHQRNSDAQKQKHDSSGIHAYVGHFKHC